MTFNRVLTSGPILSLLPGSDSFSQQLVEIDQPSLQTIEEAITHCEPKKLFTTIKFFHHVNGKEPVLTGTVTMFAPGVDIDREDFLDLAMAYDGDLFLASDYYIDFSIPFRSFSAYLESIQITPEYRGKNIGTDMIRFLQDYFHISDIGLLTTLGKEDELTEFYKKAFKSGCKHSLKNFLYFG